MPGFQIPGDLALSADGRYLLLAQGPDDVASRCDIALQTFAGSWVYDKRVGVKYMFDIFEKPATAAIDLLRSEFWRVLAETPGVTEVVSVEIFFDPVERIASVKWEAKSKAGGVKSGVVIR